MTKQKLIFFMLLMSLNVLTFGQSSSVMDASYFSRGGAEAPVRAGKGFDIRDVFKQTKNCFTKETSNSNLLKQTQQGQKTTITLHYTRNDDEYSLLQKSSSEGKISYLNLFSLGGSLLKEYSSRINTSHERLIFIAKVDFGKYEFDEEPVLTSEAKNLINQKKYQEFINLYGTHYISGIRKENSIWIVLNKKSREEGDKTLETSGNNTKMTLPMVGVNYQINNRNEFSKLIKSGEYTVSIEINGPSIDNSDIQESVESILSNEEEKVAGIERIARGALGKITDPKQSLPAQYYYTPFSLYDVAGINWDRAKEQELTNVNEQVLNVFSTKTKIEPLLENDGLEFFLKEAKVILPEDEDGAKILRSIEDKFKTTTPMFRNYKLGLDSSFVYLENRYKQCANIECFSNDNCCNNALQLGKIKEQIKQANKSLVELENAKIKIVEDFFKDYFEYNCKKQIAGSVIITNVSTNPYDIFVGDEYYMTIQSGKTEKIDRVKVGEKFTFKAQQKSGFMLYPTTNIRTFTIKKACEELKTKIGFED